MPVQAIKTYSYIERTKNQNCLIFYEHIFFYCKILEFPTATSKNIYFIWQLKNITDSALAYIWLLQDANMSQIFEQSARLFQKKKIKLILFVSYVQMLLLHVFHNAEPFSKFR